LSADLAAFFVERQTPNMIDQLSSERNARMIRTACVTGVASRMRSTGVDGTAPWDPCNCKRASVTVSLGAGVGAEPAERVGESFFERNLGAPSQIGFCFFNREKRLLLLARTLRRELDRRGRSCRFPQHLGQVENRRGDSGAYVECPIVEAPRLRQRFCRGRVG